MPIVIRVYVLCVLFVTQIYADPDNCITYMGTQGQCVNINQCPVLINLLIRYKKSSATNLLLRLNKSQCGFDKLDPMVCCGNELSDDQELLPSQPDASTALISEHSACKTQNGSAGVCISINQCPALYNVLNEKTMVSGTGLQILKQSLCGFEKMTPKVCCSVEQRPAVESVTSSPPQSHPTVSVKSAMAEECITPEGREGICVNIKQCQSLFELLKRSDQLSFEDSRGLLQTLRKVQCGFEDKEPKVCCEIEKPDSSPSSPDQLNDHQEIPKAPDITNHPSLELLDHDLCGPIPEAKIIGGTKTAVFEFPSMALIAYDTGSDLPEFRCAGSLITKRHVLTAAHCVSALPPDLRLIGIRLGEHDLSTERDCDTDIDGLDINCAEDYQDFAILAVAVHPDYPKDNHQDDIALIMLAGEADFSAMNVRPICLPVSLTTILNPKMTVTGWGATETGPQSSTLRKVTLPIIPNEECARLYKMRNIKIWHKQICAGGSDRTDSCSGDSGGPLQTIGMYNGQPRNIIYGIVSFGPRDCGSEQIPGVYTRVEYYMDWILDTIGVEVTDD